MKTSNNHKGSKLVVKLIIIISIAVIVSVGWNIFYVQQNKDSDNKEVSNNSKLSTDNDNNTGDNENENTKTIIYPNIGTGANSTSQDLSYSVDLPNGWSVQEVYGAYDMVKTIGDDKYIISSSIENNGDLNDNKNLMEQRVSEGIKTIATVKTSKGTNISILQTPTTLFLASCVPTGENCYLNLNDKDLYIHLYQIIPNAQAATNIDYSSASATEIIKDFEAIAKSLNI